MLRQLPYRTGTQGRELERDDIAISTRSTLVDLSITNVTAVLESLANLLEDLSRPRKGQASHASHIAISEAYVLSLTADCCTAHWNSIKAEPLRRRKQESGILDSGSQIVPAPLADGLVLRFLDIVKRQAEPVPDSLYLPPEHALDHTTRAHAQAKDHGTHMTGSQVLTSPTPLSDLDSGIPPGTLERDSKVLVEYLSASSWTCSLEFFRRVVYDIRTSGSSQHGPGQPVVASEEEKPLLTALRLLAFFWVDGPKLGLIIQELCSSFLHFRRPYQVTIAAVLPLLITNWLDRYPHEFVQQHTLHKRLDGGADTLFDMTQALVDHGRKKGMMFALQMTLLFLLPDVFEVASNLRDAKSSSMAKKTTFLDSLRKALRNKNEAAAYALVSLLRAARHFDVEDDAAFVSFALDIQDEVKDAIFRGSISATEGPLFEQDLLTTAFISLAQLNLDGCIDTLIGICLAPTAPMVFKAAVAQGCGYLARQRDAAKYERLFTAATPFMLGQLKVWATSSTQQISSAPLSRLWLTNGQRRMLLNSRQKQRWRHTRMMITIAQA